MESHVIPFWKIFLSYFIADFYSPVSFLCVSEPPPNDVPLEADLELPYIL